MSGCRRCQIDLLHCHGTLVRHDDGGWECSVGRCTGGVDVHDLVLTCAELWVGCCTERDGAAGSGAAGGGRYRDERLAG